MALHHSRHKKDDGAKASFVTLNKDGKPVWEPGLRAEVTSRRQPRAQRRNNEETEDGPVPCDLKGTLKLSPEARSAWLGRVISAIPKGRAKAQEVFDVITHRKFVAGVPEELGQTMLRQVKESLMFFSEKQQLNIAKSKLVKDFKPQDASKKSSRGRRHDAEDSSDCGRSSDEEALRPTRRAFAEGDRDRRREDDDGGSEARDAGFDKESERERAREEDLPKLSPEERAKIEREYAEREEERQERRVQELQRLEAERKAYEDREKQRKAKIGNAFLMGGEDEDDDLAPPLGVGRVQLAEKKREEASSLRLEEEAFAAGLKYNPGVASTTSAITTAATSSAIKTMGGDSIVNEAQQILQRGAGAFIGKNTPRDKDTTKDIKDIKDVKDVKVKRSRSRSRRRRRSPSRSISPSPRSRDKKKDLKGEDRRRRVYDSLRSPTPDGHLRGQMRAARKAKMMAQMLSQGNVPRIS